MGGGLEKSEQAVFNNLGVHSKAAIPLVSAVLHKACQRKRPVPGRKDRPRASPA